MMDKVIRILVRRGLFAAACFLSPERAVKIYCEEVTNHE